MSDTPTDAHPLLDDQDHFAETVARLEQAGDVDALMRLTVRYLVGDGVTRDLSRARASLRCAVAIGHVDGALMEVALTANGNGGAVSPDFPGARRLLDAAAVNDPVAAHQAGLLQAMKLADDGSPAGNLPDVEVLSVSPHVRRYPRLLTPDECAHVATAASELLEAAQVIDPRTGRWIPHPIRTSDGGAIGPTREDLVIRALNLRIARASGTAVQQGEPLTVLRYRPGQQYRPHLDTIEGAANQRSVTVLVYLNQGFAGGETEFPLLPLKIRPSGGDAIIFDTLMEDGTPDHRTRHAGLPVGRGAKWMATRWIRQNNVDPWTLV